MFLVIDCIIFYSVLTSHHMRNVLSVSFSLFFSFVNVPYVEFGYTGHNMERGVEIRRSYYAMSANVFEVSPCCYSNSGFWLI